MTTQLLKTPAIALAAALALAACDRADSDSVSVVPPPTAPLAQTAPERAPDRGVGEPVDDAAITAKVKHALIADASVSGTAISVTTVDGKVILEAKIPAVQLDRAVRIARAVEGVRSVETRPAS